MPIPRVELAPGYSVARIILGGWQLSAGHSLRGSRSQLFDELSRAVDLGFTTFDCADIYGGVEDLLGAFRSWLRGGGRRGAPELQIHTKFVPDRAVLPRIDRGYVRRIVERSLRRLGVEALDLVQFHWWDFDVPRWVEAALWLGELQAEGKIRHLGATNFDTPRLAALLDAGVPLVSHQVQYSLLDRRPAGAMTDLCQDRGLSLLCYGTLAGGFLTDRWLGVGSPPERLENRSLVKYRLIIDEYGGWDAFQSLLGEVADVASAVEAPLASVAVRHVLDRPAVGAAIVGLGSPGRIPGHVRTAALDLPPDLAARLEEAAGRGGGPRGDVYGLERVRGGRHAAIMRYDLNREDPGPDGRSQGPGEPPGPVP